MKLTILGCYGPYPHADGACSGYLISAGKTKILLDLGNGSLSNYLKHAKIDELNAVILSHLHPDHISDVFVLRYALEVQHLNLDLYAPKEPESEFLRLSYKDAFCLKEIDETASIEIDGMKISFCKVRHAIASYAVKVTAEGKTLVYSADTGYCDALEVFAKNCDLLLCEAAIPDTDESKKTIHMSAIQACELAMRANCKKTVLTHFFPDLPKAYYKKEIEEYTNHSDIRLAEENTAYFV